MKKNIGHTLKLTLVLFLFFIQILGNWQLLAQSQIKGKVTDAEGVPLPGASVVIQGTMFGTQTDNDGLFTIK